MPARDTVTLPPELLDWMVRLPVRAPTAVGAKANPSVQLPPVAARVMPAWHVPPRTKSALWVPPAVSTVMVRAALPTLVSVIVCWALTVPTSCGPNASELALSAIVGVGAAVEVPFKATLLDPLGALCARTSDAVNEPMTVGLNVRSIRQEAPGATPVLTEQVEVGSIRKSVAFAPDVEIALKASVAVPVFVAVTA